MTTRTETGATAKTWAGARLMKQNTKWHTRQHWTCKRWQRYHAERAEKSEHEKRPHLKETRLQYAAQEALRRQRLAAEEALYQKRRARMIAINEKRRVAKQAEINEIATMILHGVLDNLDIAHDIMRERGMIEIAPGHWRDGLTQPKPRAARHSPGAA